MCQLLGMSCKEPATINFSLEGFQARGGVTDEHKDGWGIAFYENQGHRIFRDHEPASTSALLKTIKELHIKSRTVIAHIRKATVGAVSLRNCHPFKRELWGQTWIFCHNGDLPDYHPPLTGNFTPEGETDSERAFCYMMESLSKSFPDANEDKRPDTNEIYSALQRLSHEIAACGIFNILLSNGEMLFTHCSTHLSYLSRSYPFAKATLIDCAMSMDLSAHNSHTNRMAIIATKPLTHNEPWVSCQKGETLMFCDGLVIAASHPAQAASIADTVSALVTNCFSESGLILS